MFRAICIFAITLLIAIAFFKVVDSIWVTIAGHSENNHQNNVAIPDNAYQVGMCSYYADKFHGRMTANGEIFDMHALTAAHKKLPFGTVIEVTNLNNGRRVTVRVNDRGPFAKERVLDLSYVAARKIGIIRTGVAKVAIVIQ